MIDLKSYQWQTIQEDGAVKIRPIKKLIVLIGCEESQNITKEFRKLGHEAYSCDLLPCSGGHPEWHIRGDVFEAIKSRKWDLGIFHPECTRLTVTANKWYKPEYAERFPTIHEDRESAVNFFMKLVECSIPNWAIENPIGIMSTRYRKPNQVIQPYQFGDPERKSTCLWLNGLPKLTHTNIVQPDIIYHKSGRTDGKLHFETMKLPKEVRRKARSVTFPGIARAIADQWSRFLLQEFAQLHTYATEGLEAGKVYDGEALELMLQQLEKVNDINEWIECNPKDVFRNMVIGIDTRQIIRLKAGEGK